MGRDVQSDQPRSPPTFTDVGGDQPKKSHSFPGRNKQCDIDGGVYKRNRLQAERKLKRLIGIDKKLIQKLYTVGAIVSCMWESHSRGRFPKSELDDTVVLSD